MCGIQKRCKNSTCTSIHPIWPNHAPNSQAGSFLKRMGPASYLLHVSDTLMKRHRGPSNRLYAFCWSILLALCLSASVFATPRESVTSIIWTFHGSVHARFRNLGSLETQLYFHERTLSAKELKSFIPMYARMGLSRNQAMTYSSMKCLSLP